MNPSALARWATRSKTGPTRWGSTRSLGVKNRLLAAIAWNALARAEEASSLYAQFAKILQSEMKRTDRTGRSFAMLAFDLDGVKQIDDTQVHPMRIRTLERLENVLHFSFRSVDTMVRYRSDRLAVVLPETGAREASLAGRRICACLASNPDQLRISVSVRVSVYPEDGATVEALLERANCALYEMRNPEKNG